MILLQRTTVSELVCPTKVCHLLEEGQLLYLVSSPVRVRSSLSAQQPAVQVSLLNYILRSRYDVIYMRAQYLQGSQLRVKDNFKLCVVFQPHAYCLLCLAEETISCSHVCLAMQGVAIVYFVMDSLWMVKLAFM